MKRCAKSPAALGTVGGGVPAVLADLRVEEASSTLMRARTSRWGSGGFSETGKKRLGRKGDLVASLAENFSHFVEVLGNEAGENVNVILLAAREEGPSVNFLGRHTSLLSLHHHHDRLFVWGAGGRGAETTRASRYSK